MIIDWGSLISSNQFVSGGFLLILFGGILASLRAAPARVWRWARSRILYSVELDNSEAVHGWLKAWLADHAKGRFMGAGVKPSLESSPNGGPRTRPVFCLWPRDYCWFRYRGRRVLAWLTKEPLQIGSGYRETITLQCLGNGRSLFESLLTDAYDHVADAHGEVVEVWTCNGFSWELLDRKPVRRPETLCLPAGVAEQVLDRAVAFRAAREWYVQRGVPWRLGFLLKGPPGNGKSSLVHVLASLLKSHVSVANVSTFADDNKLAECLMKVPADQILLLEDVDCVFRERKASASQQVTLSGLLNVLDGISAKDGRIVVLTTNCAEVLDPALIRPGRCDVHVHLGNATPEQARQMFARFHPGMHFEALAFSAVLPDGVSMAAVQAHLLTHADDPHAAVKEPVAVIDYRESAEKQGREVAA